MNWLKERDILIPTCEDFKYFSHHDKFTRQQRSKIVANTNFTCRYCGGVYPKYLICSYISKLKLNDVTCRACYLITHLNYGMFKEMKVYYSELSQLDIVKRTINSIIENNEIPSANLIDPSVKTVEISLLEYINIINNYDTIPQEFVNYKIFFSSKFNIEFITNNYGNKMITFVDPYNDTEEKKVSIDKTLEKHVVQKEEMELINKYYY